MGTVHVSAMGFRSTHLKTLSASPDGVPLAVVGLLAIAGPTSHLGRHRVLTKSVG
jgi:hypothetical protein